MGVDIDILGAGIAAPGLPNWPALVAALAGAAIEDSALPQPPQLLSPRERRRAPAAVRLSFPAAEEACAMAGLAVSEPVAVFSSGMGDLDITDYLCRSLVDAPEQLSPTRFHNSVHNAASGYWSIGAGATGDVTAMSGWRDSALAGLIEAMCRVVCEPRPLLLVIYDDVAPATMSDLWTAGSPFAAALVLAPAGTPGAMARFSVDTVATPSATVLRPAWLQSWVDGNPAARVLPLLARIADPCPEPVVLPAEQGPSLSFRSRSL